MNRVMCRLLLLALAFFIGCSPRPMVLPEDMRVSPPAPELPKQVANYSGIWQGKWSNKQECKIVIEEITLTAAKGIYAWGEWCST